MLQQARAGASLPDEWASAWLSPRQGPVPNVRPHLRPIPATRRRTGCSFVAIGLLGSHTPCMIPSETVFSIGSRTMRARRMDLSWASLNRENAALWSPTPCVPQPLPGKTPQSNLSRDSGCPDTHHRHLCLWSAWRSEKLWFSDLRVSDKLRITQPFAYRIRGHENRAVPFLLSVLLRAWFKNRGAACTISDFRCSSLQMGIGSLLKPAWRAGRDHHSFRRPELTV